MTAGARTADVPARRLREELAPSRLVPTLTFGLVLGAVEVVLAISLAALIFGGRLSARFVSEHRKLGEWPDLGKALARRSVGEVDDDRLE